MLFGIALDLGFAWHNTVQGIQRGVVSFKCLLGGEDIFVGNGGYTLEVEIEDAYFLVCISFSKFVCDKNTNDM